MDDGAAVRLAEVTKRYPGVVALDGVSFEIARGSCRAICGENGAGKSTLGKLLCGIERPDSGTIEIDGQPVRFDSPADALACGVAMVHQELASCTNMSVEENLTLGRIPSRWSFVDRRAMRARAKAMLADVGAEIDPGASMASLRVAEQQLVQIAMAVGSGARVLVFDEPTSSLSEREAMRLYALVKRLTGRGATVIYVSHRMQEIFRLSGTVTVLRDGAHVDTRPTAELDERSLVQLIIGRPLGDYFPAHLLRAPGQELLGVDGLSSRGAFEDVSLTVRAGEIVGLAGLVGAGRSEVAKALFGLMPHVSGSIRVNGHPVAIRSSGDAIAAGIGFVPEDRKREGLVLQMSAVENITLPLLERVSRGSWIMRGAEQSLARRLFERLRITPRAEAAAAELSGGNQQKLLLARWLAAGSRLLILDEPTRGVDVGAKAELHAWIDQLAVDGHGILLISSELPELLHLSTRIIVLRSGRIVGEVSRADATQELLLRLMAGLTAAATAA